MCVSSLHTIFIRMTHYFKDLCPIIMGSITSENGTGSTSSTSSEIVSLEIVWIQGIQWFFWWSMMTPQKMSLYKKKCFSHLWRSTRIKISRTNCHICDCDHEIRRECTEDDGDAPSCYILFLWEKNYASLLDEANEDVNQPSILTNHSANITEWIDSCAEHANQFHCSQMGKHSRPGGLLSKLLTFLLWVSLESDTEQILFFEKLISSFYIIHLFTLHYSQGWCTYNTLNVLFCLITLWKTFV